MFLNIHTIALFHLKELTALQTKTSKFIEHLKNSVRKAYNAQFKCNSLVTIKLEMILK